MSSGLKSFLWVLPLYLLFGLLIWDKGVLETRTLYRLVILERQSLQHQKILDKTILMLEALKGTFLKTSTSR